MKSPGQSNERPDPRSFHVDVVTVAVPVTVRYRVHHEVDSDSEAHRGEPLARLERSGATRPDPGRGDGAGTGAAVGRTLEEVPGGVLRFKGS